MESGGRKNAASDHEQQQEVKDHGHYEFPVLSGQARQAI